ncbi:HHL1-like protein [Gloeobacter kilaueensis]|uniref:Uncharacterized protein n=1 Tax=Gloeobacter kilaueensis (strain ATCC BAA-2537 / CCAP 1431/1 / ULC 316 / JS1) TaxID=1183438 RepID=U5QNZ7_GLOK1|nr:HHL1-like protein [Gloeobacter kilaueensis]AGY60727.1 hypothetical protein GKIL_4481 [Gloeobacter kilaueensis JS1]
MAEQSEGKPKGFGKATEPARPATPKKKRRAAQPRLSDEEYQARRRYADAEKKGEPTFEIFVRESAEAEWKPSGAIAVSSNLIERAIFDSEEKLRQSARRQYASLRKVEGPLEYGFRRKEFPDDPIQLAKRPKKPLFNQLRSFLDQKFGTKQNKKK